MIINKLKDGKTIYKSWRENDEKKYEFVETKPYFFVKEDSQEPTTYAASKYIRRDFEYITGDWINLEKNH